MSITFQSPRYFKTSEPISPRSGMNGTPFSDACSAACSAGQVASFMVIVPAVTAAEKRGAGPNSPRLTALVSSVATQPAPISRSACRLEVGSATRCSRLTPRLISARVAAIGTPETSRGTTSRQPSRMTASASSSDFAACNMRTHNGAVLAPFLNLSFLCLPGPLDFATGMAVPMTLQEKLAAGRFVITAEVTPPASAARGDFLAKALPLRDVADAVNVTDGAGARPHLAAVSAAAMLVEAGIEPVLQFTCRDRNRIALQSDLIAAAASGVRNLLMLRGDDPSAGDQPDAKPVFDLDPRQLLETARRLRDTGELPSGRKIGGRADFFLGGADNPIDPPPGWEPKSLAGKLAAGAQFVQTQFCMDAGVVRRYVARLAEHGIAGKARADHRRGAAALGEIGALDQGKALSARSSPTR